MSYLLHDESFLYQTQPNQTYDGFYQPQPEDKAMGTQVPCDPIKPMETQPSPVGILYDDTPRHYMNELVFTTPEDAKSWARQHAQKDMCLEMGEKEKLALKWFVREVVIPRKATRGRVMYIKGKTSRKNKTFSKKIKCPFKLAFNYNQDLDGWVLYRVTEGRHNHPRPEHLEGHFMEAKLNPQEMEKVAKMRTMGISPLQMLQILKEDNKDNQSSLSTIYNAIETIRKKEWIDNHSSLSTIDYAVQKDVDSDEEITQLFIAHPTSVQLAQCFHEVLIIDCTYKTNKYEMPLLNIVGRTSTKSPFSIAFCFLRDDQKPSYIWALQQVKAIIRGDDIPGVIVTDNDVALMNAIEEVFPLAHNMLCTFHIWCNLMNRCKPIICPPKKIGYEEVKMLLEKERAEEKVEKQYDINYAKWVAFNGEWESLCWSLTEEEYYLNLTPIGILPITPVLYRMFFANG